MRRASCLIGILGTIAGLALEAFLFLRPYFRTPAQPATKSHLVHVTLALLLALAGLAAALAVRKSPRAGALFLPAVAVLGFFLGVDAWAPAGALFLTSGALAFLAARESSDSKAPPVPALAPQGTSLHWSEAAKQGISSAPVLTGDVRREAGWSRSRKAGFAGIIVLAAVLIIPASLWSSGSAPAPLSPTNAQAKPTNATVTLGTVASSSSTTSTSVAAAVNTAPSTTKPGASTTSSSLPSDLANYADTQHQFRLVYPAVWKKTPYQKLGEAGDDQYAVVGFADWKGPQVAGEYLDFIQVDVFEDRPLDSSMLPILKAGMEQDQVEAKKEFKDFKILEPLHEVTIAGLPALTQLCSFTLSGRTEVFADLALIANGRGYQLEVSAVKADWNRDQSLFRTIIQNFGVSPLA
jgi:hypothetical protein